MTEQNNHEQQNWYFQITWYWLVTQWTNPTIKTLGKFLILKRTYDAEHINTLDNNAHGDRQKENRHKTI